MLTKEVRFVLMAVAIGAAAIWLIDNFYINVGVDGQPLKPAGSRKVCQYPSEAFLDNGLIDLSKKKVRRTGDFAYIPVGKESDVEPFKDGDRFLLWSELSKWDLRYAKRQWEEHGLEVPQQLKEALESK